MMFRTANESSSIKQIEVNAVFFHRELGIKAGFPRFSWRPNQKINAGTMAREMASSKMLEASRRLDALNLTELIGVDGQHS